MKLSMFVFLLFINTSIFSQKDYVKTDGKSWIIDSLSSLYKIEIFAVISYYTTDTVFTEIQVIRPCKEYPQGKWLFLKPRKIVSDEN